MNKKVKELDKKKSRKKAKLQPVSKSKYRNLKNNYDRIEEDDNFSPKISRKSNYDDFMDE